MRDNSFFTEKSYEELSKTIDFEFLVNDHMDLLVRIRNKNDFIDDGESEGFHRHSCHQDKESAQTEHNTIYYYENLEFKFPQVCARNIPIVELEQNQGIYTTKNHRNAQFIMNKKYLFFWEHK